MDDADGELDEDAEDMERQAPELLEPPERRHASRASASRVTHCDTGRPKSCSLP